MFEPASKESDKTQIIGRATRVYGQCGLQFKPNIGWPLHVFIYDIVIPEPLRNQFQNAKSLFELYYKLYIQSSSLDIQLPIFVNELEKLSIFGAVDYQLTRILHNHYISDEYAKEFFPKRKNYAVEVADASSAVSNISQTSFSKNKTKSKKSTISKNKTRSKKSTSNKSTFSKNPLSKSVSISEKKSVSEMNPLSKSVSISEKKSVSDTNPFSKSISEKKLVSEMNPLSKSVSALSKSDSKSVSEKKSFSDTLSSMFAYPEQNTKKGGVNLNDIPIKQFKPRENKIVATNYVVNKNNFSVPFSRFPIRLTHQNVEKFVMENFVNQYKWTEQDFNATCQNEPAMKPYLTKYPVIKGQTYQSLSVQFDSKLDENDSINDQKPFKVDDDENTNCQPLINLNPTQKFIPEYFVPENTALKGMLLWHGTGTGKTCIAVATATNEFEKQGYTILWVTRSSLKADFYKNIFEQSCHKGFREKLAKCDWTIPTDMQDRLKLLSPSWQIPPLSYKQFTNLISRKNNYYQQLTRINGTKDPLQKTLLIIDEAHKLFNKQDLNHQEMPNVEELKNALHHSYNVSGKNSVRVLLMSATPIGETSMELIQLLNLCKESHEQMPENFQEFSINYLDDSGMFTNHGKRKYLDQIAGRISYLNREKDYRLFSQPVIQKVEVPLLDDPTILDNLNQTANPQQKAKQEKIIKRFNTVIQLLNSIVDYTKQFDSTYFDKKLNRCSTFHNPELKRKCQQLVDKHLQEIGQVIRPFFSKYKLLLDHVKLEKKMVEQNHEKEESTRKQNSILRKNKLSDFSKSLYSVLLSKCGQDEIDTTQQETEWKLHPTIMKLTDSIEILKEEQNTLENQLLEAQESYDAKLEFNQGLSQGQETNKLKYKIEHLEKLVQTVSLEIKDLVRQKKDLLQKMKKQWLNRAREVQANNKTRRKKQTNYNYHEEVFPVNQDQELYSGGTDEPLDNLVNTDVQVLLEKLNPTIVENRIKKINAFIKKLIYNHSSEIDKELGHFGNRL